MLGIFKSAVDHLIHHQAPLLRPSAQPRLGAKENRHARAANVVLSLTSMDFREYCGIQDGPVTLEDINSWMANEHMSKTSHKTSRNLANDTCKMSPSCPQSRSGMKISMNLLSFCIGSKTTFPHSRAETQVADARHTTSWEKMHWIIFWKEEGTM